MYLSSTMILFIGIKYSVRDLGLLFYVNNYMPGPQSIDMRLIGK